MNKDEVLSEHASTWKTNGLSAFEGRTEFVILQEEHLSPYCLKVTVQLALNEHWTDEKCKENDMQY
jgi:hypothetical protein